MEIGIAHYCDEVVEKLGYRMDSDYVEDFWLPSVGPTTLLLARRLFNLERRGFTTIDVDELAPQLGLHGHGRNSPLIRSIRRMHSFGLAVIIERDDSIIVGIRSHLAPLTTRQHERLPELLKTQHTTFINTQPRYEKRATA